MEIGFRIEILHLARLEGCLLDPVLRAEFMLGADSRAEVLELGLHKSSLIARRQMLHRGYPVKIALMNDNHARSQLGCVDHGSIPSVKRLLPCIS